MAVSEEARESRLEKAPGRGVLDGKGEAAKEEERGKGPKEPFTVHGRVSLGRGRKE